MTYLFEEIIKFDVRNNCLIHIETDDNIRLAPSGCMLLERFIHNQGKIITRNQLLEDIFKKNNRTDSDSNLSQSISMLRKGFRDLGVDKDILITKPRVGLLLSEEVKIEPFNEDKIHPLNGILNNTISIKFMYPILLFILISVVSALFFFYPLFLSGMNSSDEAMAVNINGCKVYILNHQNAVREHVAILIRQQFLQCDDRDSFYYPDNDPVAVSFDSLVHCRTTSSNGEVCTSYLFRRKDD
ncbi:transcriptional regulator [Klebsiella oxytoca]